MSKIQSTSSLYADVKKTSNTTIFQYYSMSYINYFLKKIIDVIL